MLICFSNNSCGGIAQLGERLNGIQEVSGSIPLISTKISSKCWILSNVSTIFFVLSANFSMTQIIEILIKIMLLHIYCTKKSPPKMEAIFYKFIILFMTLSYAFRFTTRCNYNILIGF